ncbi:bifunctional 2',3'-cyclic-nucleotide 2'-phosphodiesterase/3'-nucleotidase [Paracoccus sp. (in: a-proteobacteria)]|uniref:bifunctional 2',3'-cyclic-nucleotide 2'-phosphodiesterase/3'-nucleotidase n=1 Tax=Paracoccus sp. TaxID=267 RepID=UPI003A8573FC
MPDGNHVTPDSCLGADSEQCLSLRILATTDMHMNVLPYDYLADRPCDRHGLARTASLIARGRRQNPNTLLLDNGDFLQGNPLGDYVAERLPPRPDRPHPAIAAMNALGYDAAALGNHDFNFGLRFLRGAVAGARFPVLAANLRLHRRPDFPGYTILRRQFHDQGGAPCLMKIGVIGLLPPQTGDWDLDLSGQLVCGDIVETARRLVPVMKAEGADLIVALGHTGIGPLLHQPGMEHCATALAAVEGIDAVIAGHTHQVFPGPQIPAGPGIDPRRGTLAGKPAVMAGFGGSHLGVIDLELRPLRDHGWSVADFAVRAEPVDRALPACPDILTPIEDAHRATLRHYRRRVGQTQVPLNSFFSLLGQDHALRLVNTAQRDHVRDALRGTRWESLPVLSAAAPFRAGGRAGPGHYTDVPAGPLTLRNLADLYLFPNRICAIHVTGAGIAEWLERAAGQFRQIQPGATDAPLISDDFPCYNFDVIDGLSWRIDLAAPRRFGPTGTLLNPDTARIQNLRGPTGPVRSGDEFILATSTYRLSACGLFAGLATERPVALSDGTATQEVLRRFVRRNPSLRPVGPPNFSFCPMPGTSVLFDTSPAALPHLNGLSLPPFEQIECTGQGPDGFVRLKLHMYS